MLKLPIQKIERNYRLFGVISIATAFMPLDRLMSGVGFSPNLLPFGLKPQIAFTFYRSLKATAIEEEPMNR